MTAVAEPQTGIGAKFGVHSEVGTLRKVMIHRPDLELKRLTPANHDELLFDDVIWIKRAIQQHDAFADILSGRGVTVYHLEDLLADTMAITQARQWKLDRAVSPATVCPRTSDEIRAYLNEVEPDTLADALIGGLTALEAVNIVHNRHPE